jgi:hypothetical protein
MATSWDDPEKLRKIARITLGYEEEDADDEDDVLSDEKVSHVVQLLSPARAVFPAGPSVRS